MAPVQSRMHVNTLAILEQQILGWKKSSVSRRPDKIPIRLGASAQGNVRKPTKRKRLVNESTLSAIVTKTKSSGKRMQGKKHRKCKNKKSKNITQQKGKSNINLFLKNNTYQKKFPLLLVQDASESNVEPPTMFQTVNMRLTERPGKEPLEDWLPRHPTITKDMRREQAEFVVFLASKFIFGDRLGFHAVYILDSFMCKTPERVVTPGNFKVVAVAAFVVALNSRSGQEIDEIISALTKLDFTEMQQVKRFSNFIQSTIGSDQLTASDGLDIIGFHSNNKTVGTDETPKMHQVCMQSQKLMMEAAKSYTVMTHTDQSALATSAILVSCELMNENCCQLFPNLVIPTSAIEIKRMNITMHWFRQVHRNMNLLSVKPKRDQTGSVTL